MAFAAGVRIGPYEILALLGAGGMGEVYKARDTRLNRVIALKILPMEKVADADRKRRYIGPYEILALLGAGGMGEVYKARDTRLNRVIALKILPMEKVADADRKRRFLVEAQAASRLNHPNIVTIHDISEENSVCFIAMEYVAGTTLEQANTCSGLPLKHAMKYAAEIADALAAAHAAGIIHRDLKPANFIISEEGRVKLLDFGLAELIEPSVPAAEAETATLHTVPGAIMGTAAYMSPEQADGRELDARSDIFSF